ncbi:hypothetical protein MZE77_22460, partial [Escherichia coli]|nr:hypothetical protein [Escherichia coli]
GLLLRLIYQLLLVQRFSSWSKAPVKRWFHLIARLVSGLSAFYDTATKKHLQTVVLTGLFHFSQQSRTSLRFMR